MTETVLVLGLDDLQRPQLDSVRNAERIRFVPLYETERIAHSREGYALGEILEEGLETLRAFEGSIDGIVGFWDFPTSALLPLLRREFDLPGPSLEQVLRCEHKWWSRVLQREVLGPDHVPDFAAVDPFAAEAPDELPLEYPFWLKPVKAHSSHLGFRIHNRQELDRALSHIRNGIDHFGKPFNWALDRADIPDEVRRVNGYCCVAEAIIDGHQCTAEGFVYGDEVRVYGIVDSVREMGRSSFSRYQYPSRLPEAIQEEIVRLTDRVVRHLGLDMSCFNIEYFWDHETDRLWLLEINARLSNSHAPLFQKVDGRSHFEVAVDLARGVRPDPPSGEGEFAVAAKFMYRRFKDAWVERLPSAAEIAEAERAVPGAEIQLSLQEGMHLSEIPEQDAYSFEIMKVFLGGADEGDLLRRYHGVLERLQMHLIEEPNP